MEKIYWPDPSPEMLASPEFEAVWSCIKSWDINVPEAYEGYCGATGNHVRAILSALRLTEGDGKMLWAIRQAEFKRDWKILAPFLPDEARARVLQGEVSRMGAPKPESQ